MGRAVEVSDPKLADLLQREDERQAQSLLSDPLGELRVRGGPRGHRHRPRPTSTPRDTRASATTRASSSSTRSRRSRSTRAKALFGVEHANVQPYSGSPANLAVYLAFLEPGDTVMGMSLPMGGHLTHGWPVSATGKWFNAGALRRRPRDRPGRLGRGARPRARRAARSSSSAAARRFPARSTSPASPRSRARSVPCWSRTSRTSPGLIAGGAHPSPVGHADVISTTTHKTLRGPRGAMLMCRRSTRRRSTRLCSPGSRAARTTTPTAAIAVALREARDAGVQHLRARRSSPTRRRSPTALIERGFDLVSGGTDNHLILLDLTRRASAASRRPRALARAGIVTNYNTSPSIPASPSTRQASASAPPRSTTRGLTRGRIWPRSRSG